MAESSVPGAVGERTDKPSCDICDGMDPPRNPYWRDNATKTCDPCENRMLVAMTAAFDQRRRAARPAGGAVGEREELDVERLRKAWYGHEDTHPGLPCVAVKCVEEVAFAYSKGK